MAALPVNRIGIRVLVAFIAFLVSVFLFGVFWYVLLWLVALSFGNSGTFSEHVSMPLLFYIALAAYLMAPAFILYYLGIFLLGKAGSKGLKMVWGAVCTLLSFISMIGFSFNAFTGSAFFFSALPIGIAGALIPVWTGLITRRLQQRLQN